MTAADPPKVIVWVAEGTWRGCADAARALAPAGASLVLLHVTTGDAPGARARGRASRWRSGWARC